MPDRAVPLRPAAPIPRGFGRASHREDGAERHGRVRCVGSVSVGRLPAVFLLVRVEVRDGSLSAPEGYRHGVLLSRGGRPWPIDAAEARLAYVAVTRARLGLDLGGLSWIEAHPAEQVGGVPTAPGAEAPEACEPPG